MPRITDKDSDGQSSYQSSFASRNSIGTRNFNKYELKRKFYEKLDDFKGKTLLYKEPGIVVYRARCSYSGGVVVLKGYSRETLNIPTRQRVLHEVHLLQTAQCPFMLKCFDSFEDNGWWWLVLENCAAGDLYRIVQNSGPIKEEGWLVSQVLLPVLQTLAYLHSEGIIHRDLKPEHILFNSEKVAKLSGFYLSCNVSKHGWPKDMVGTLDYVAPEVFILNNPDNKRKQGNYDYKVDVWGVGILTYDMLVGTPPFNSEDPNQTVENILMQEPAYPEFLSDAAVDFISQCLKKDPSSRPSARALLSHRWIRPHIDWEPPEDFDDPIPDIDTSYYKLYADFGFDKELAELEDEGMSDDLVYFKWYDPRTWRRPEKIDEQDLAGLDPDVKSKIPGWNAVRNLAGNLWGGKQTNKADATGANQDDLMDFDEPPAPPDVMDHSVQRKTGLKKHDEGSFDDSGFRKHRTSSDAGIVASGSGSGRSFDGRLIASEVAMVSEPALRPASREGSFHMQGAEGISADNLPNTARQVTPVHSMSRASPHNSRPPSASVIHLAAQGTPPSQSAPPDLARLTLAHMLRDANDAGPPPPSRGGSMPLVSGRTGSISHFPHRPSNTSGTADAEHAQHTTTTTAAPMSHRSTDNDPVHHIVTLPSMSVMNEGVGGSVVVDTPLFVRSDVPTKIDVPPLKLESLRNDHGGGEEGAAPSHAVDASSVRSASSLQNTASSHASGNDETSPMLPGRTTSGKNGYSAEIMSTDV